MKNSILTFILILSISCQESKESNLKEFEISFRKVMEDRAFKENAKIDIQEIRAISYDTIDENTIDTFRLLKINDEISYFNDLVDKILAVAKSDARLARLSGSIDRDGTLTSIYKEDLKDGLKKAEMYQDSIKVYEAKYLEIENRLKGRKKVDLAFSAKFFVKAVFSKDGKSENVLDTIFVNFDKNKKFIALDR